MLITYYLVNSYTIEEEILEKIELNASKFKKLKEFFKVSMLIDFNRKIIDKMHDLRLLTEKFL